MSAGTERRHRHLVEQRLEQMMVLAIDARVTRDARRVAQALRRVQAGEACADDDDLLQVLPRCAVGLRCGSMLAASAHSTMGSTRGETSLQRRLVVDPAEFVVLGAAELFDHGQRDVGGVGAGQVVARDLAAAVRTGLGVDLAPGELRSVISVSSRTSRIAAASGSSPASTIPLGNPND